MAARRAAKKPAPRKASFRAAAPKKAPERRPAARPTGRAAAPRKALRKAIRKPKVVARTDQGVPGMPKLRVPNRPDQVHRNTADRRAFKEKDFEAFFQAEIEAELQSPAEIFNDRIARWRCQCCDAVIPVPRRTTVFHGEFVLEHDDTEGLLVNGAKFVPRTETPLQLVQPGRLRNPFTGRRLEDENYQPVDLS